MVLDIFLNYIQSISKKFSYEETSEMGYRTDFEDLLKGIFESINVTRFDHDAKADHGNKPDFVVRKNDIPILYIEAKDIGISLDKVEKSEQMSRYFGYSNLVLTDYVEFRFYRNGLPYGEPIKIANFDKNNKDFFSIADNYEYLAKTLIDFASTHKEPIRSGAHLAKIMGGKAQRIRDNVRHLFEQNEKRDEDLTSLYDAIKNMLVNDLTPHTFADMYAQTLVYGLFVARYYDKSKNNFTRSEARELIPNTNRFLKRFFDHIVGVEFKGSLKYIVDELCEVFSHADVSKLMEDYFKVSKDTSNNYDPVIHFYEDFLHEYDPELKKKMGAYYTPQPVVNFIVKSVDNILKKQFGLVNGLADTSKLDNKKHRVQILDPATGTGTFISTIIREIYYPFKKNGQEGRWPAYVHNDLLPRIHGFELMMAPYTIAHLRLGIAFRKTGFWDFHRRLGIYLTNSLERGSKQQEMFAFGLAESIADESKEAAIIKNETPVMVVIGNPPYSGVSSNETEYANSLVDRYKVEPGGQQKLQERKHWLNDDYVKFISLAETMVSKSGEGIVAMITNNGYLDNPTFRGMRWHLAKTFDTIFILDLHGSAKKKEKSPDGSKDENVFDIMQGVGIILAIKTGKKKPDQLATVYHSELYGTRKYKFEELDKPRQWQKLTLDSKMLYFVPKNHDGEDEYNLGFSLDDLFKIKTTGIVTGIDRLSIFYSKESLGQITQEILNSPNPYIEFKIKDGRKYKKEERWKELKESTNNEPTTISYRPFDERYMYYTRKSECWINSPRSNVMDNYLNKDNYGLLITKNVKDKEYRHVFVTKNISEAIFLSGTTATNAINLPLYLYDINNDKIANLDEKITQKIKETIEYITPENLCDYIYAVLYSSSYREKYKEFLKTDFPRVPYPKDKSSFNNLVKLGKELRELHLLESAKVNKFITTFSIEGSDIVEKLEFKDGNVYINDQQYFGNVPKSVWEFYIGGYQPAQKWLKDRKGQKLTNEDLEHYQKIIVALAETIKMMDKIEEVWAND